MQTEVLNPCAHHWRLETPDGGRFVSGHCLKCGLTRNDFRVGEERWGAEAGDDLHYLFASEPRQHGYAW